MTIRDVTLDTQNEVKQIAVTSSADGEVAFYLDGDFDSAAVEIGRKVGSVFKPITGGSITSDFDFAMDCGRDMEIYARALGASPDVDIQTTVID